MLEGQTTTVSTLSALSHGAKVSKQVITHHHHMVGKGKFSTPNRKIGLSLSRKRGREFSAQQGKWVQDLAATMGCKQKLSKAITKQSAR